MPTWLKSAIVAGAVLGIMLNITFGVFRLHERMGWCGEPFLCRPASAPEEKA